jgi:hypothetical protein
MEAVPLVKGTGEGLKNHVKNFLECRKNRNPNTNASVEIGAHIAKFSHLGNIAYRSGKKLVWDGSRFTNDDEVNKYLIPSYRAPWKLPTI